MKKKLILTMILILTISQFAHASVNETFNDFQIVKIFSDGEEVKTSTPAILVDGTTMIPVRMLEQFGFSVEWDGNTYSVEITPPEPVVIEVPVQNQPSDPEPAKETSNPVNTDTQANDVSDQPKPTNIPRSSTSSGSENAGSEESSNVSEPEETSSPNDGQDEPKEDNTAACKRIRDKYAGKIAMLSYEGLTQGQMEYKKMQLEHQRDQELDDAGC